MPETSKDPSRTPPEQRRATVRDEEKKRQSGLQTLKKIDSGSVLKLETTYETSIVVNSSKSNSASVFFSPAIQSNYGTAFLPASSQFVYSNYGAASSTAQITALYEHVRGYVYRDTTLSANAAWNSYLSSPMSTFVVSQSTTSVPPCLPTGTGALSGIRVMFMNRSFYGDRIKQGTFRMDVQPMFVNVNAKQSLLFSNDNATQSSTGQFAALTGMGGLTGSLSSGLSGSLLTGFTIAIRFKPVNAGPRYQKLFERRSGNISLSALNGFQYDVPGASAINNTYVKYKYGDMYPLSAVYSIVAGNKTNFSYNTYWNNSVAFTDSPTNLAASRLPELTAGSSGVITITNKGGGTLRWAISSQFNWLTLLQNVTIPVSNGTFDSNMGGNWVNSISAAMVSPGVGGGGSLSAVSWTNLTNGNMIGGHIIVNTKLAVPTVTAGNEAIWQRFRVPAGASGVVVSFDLSASASPMSETGSTVATLNLYVGRIGTGTTPNTRTALSTQQYFHSSQNLTRYSFHVDFCARAPQYEFAGEDIWIGFTPNLSTTEKMFHIDNVEVAYAPSTIFSLSNTSSSTATITAFVNYNASTTSNGYSVQGNVEQSQQFILSQNIVLYNRTKNLEFSPNMPINIPFSVVCPSALPGGA